jgi:hypothetical protein
MIPMPHIPADNPDRLAHCEMAAETGFRALLAALERGVGRAPKPWQLCSIAGRHLQYSAPLADEREILDMLEQIVASGTAREH